MADSVRRTDRSEELIRELLYQVQYAEQELGKELERAKGDIERAQNDLEDGLTLNSLGILQSTGSNVDKVVMRRHQAFDALVKAMYYLGYDKPETDRWWMDKQLKLDQK